MLTPVTATSSASPTIRTTGTQMNNGALLSASVQAAPASDGSQTGMDLPAGTMFASVNAVVATAGTSTVLQSIALNVAALLNLARRDDETLVALFQRIATAIDALSPAERQAIEKQSGLATAGIRLTDLAAALRKPDGPVAARIVAMIEAPFATPARTAAVAATSSYLAEGTGTTQAAETLAMRSAAQANVSGRGLFSAEVRSPLPERNGADAQTLQAHLKDMFEPDGKQAERTERTETARPEPARGQAASAAAIRPEAHAGASASSTEIAPKMIAASATAATGAISTETPTETRVALEAGSTPATNDVDATLEAVTEAATETEEPMMPAAQAAKAAIVPQAKEQQPVTIRLREALKDIISGRILTEAKAEQKADAEDHRLQTYLTLKGFAEVVTRPVDALTEPPTQTPTALPNPAALKIDTPDGRRLPAAVMAEAEAEAGRMPASLVAEAQEAAESVLATSLTMDDEDDATGPRRAARDIASASQATESTVAASTEEAASQIGTASIIPFAPAQLAPAREAFRPARAMDEDQDDEDHPDSNAKDEGDGEAADGKQRRARDEWDDIGQDITEAADMPAITRDSDDADRAYAMYRRMSGF